MNDHAYSNFPQADDESFNVGPDGELLDAVFCLRCGSMNDPDVLICKECGDPLIEQGTELRSRLGRIRRYARGEDLGALSGLTAQEFRASIRQLLTPVKHSYQVNTNRQALIVRIAQKAPTINDSLQPFLLPSQPVDDSLGISPRFQDTIIPSLLLGLIALGIVLITMGLIILSTAIPLLR